MLAHIMGLGNDGTMIGTDYEFWPKSGLVILCFFWSTKHARLNQTNLSNDEVEVLPFAYCRPLHQVLVIDLQPQGTESVFAAVTELYLARKYRELCKSRRLRSCQKWDVGRWDLAMWMLKMQYTG